jgi:hypothetical protein
MRATCISGPSLVRTSTAISGGSSRAARSLVSPTSVCAASISAALWSGSSVPPSSGSTSVPTRMSKKYRVTTARLLEGPGATTATRCSSKSRHRRPGSNDHCNLRNADVQTHPNGFASAPGSGLVTMPAGCGGNRFSTGPALSDRVAKLEAREDALLVPAGRRPNVGGFSTCSKMPISNGYETQVITARAKSSQKFGASVRRRPRAIKAQTIATEIFNVIILAIPAENIRKADAGNFVGASWSRGSTRPRFISMSPGLKCPGGAPCGSSCNSRSKLSKGRANDM